MSVAVSTTLYGAAQRCDNPGEYQHVDVGGAGPQQRPGAGIDGGAGGQHVVDQDQPFAGDPGLLFRRHAERTLYVVGALRLRQADLLRRGAHALDAAMEDRHS